MKVGKKKVLSKLKKVVLTVFNIFEKYIPDIAFLVLFVSLLILIAYRYIFYSSMDWLYELSVIMFVWCGILAVSYGSRADEHIAFTILYDKISEKKKLIIRLLGNLIVFATFIILLPIAWKDISFMSITKSPILRIPQSILYSPFIIFIILTIIHHIVLFIRDIRLCVNYFRER